MATAIETEAPPRVSIDTVIGETPDKQDDGVEVVRQGSPALSYAMPQVETHSIRSAEAMPAQRVEWEHIRRQLVMGPEVERRVDWEQIRDQLGLSEDDEESISFLKQIAQAFLVLATTPFMLLHGVFKMTGALLRSLGMVFTGLAKLSRKLTYKPKKKKSKYTLQAGTFSESLALVELYFDGMSGTGPIQV